MADSVNVIIQEVVLTNVLLSLMLIEVDCFTLQAVSSLHQVT